MLRVGFVLRSTEIQPVCFRFVSPTVYAFYRSRVDGSGMDSATFEATPKAIPQTAGSAVRGAEGSLDGGCPKMRWYGQLGVAPNLSRFSGKFRMGWVPQG